MLWTREVGSVDTGCLQMPKGIFGVTGTPVYDPVGGFIYLAATDRLWAIDVHTGAARPGWPVALPVDQYHEHVWGAIALGNGHVYFGIASYCDRRPYSGRVLSVSTRTGAVDHSWTSVTTPTGDPGGGGIWGWGGVAITSDGHVWAAVANANIAQGSDEALDHAESVVELSSALALLTASHAPGHAEQGRLRLRLDARSSSSRPACGALVAAEGKDGALYLWQRATLAAGPGAAARAGVPGHALRLARLGSEDAAAVRDDLAGLRRHPVGGLDALALTAQVQAPARLDEGPRRSAQRHPDGRQQHGHRRHGHRAPARLRRPRRAG